MKPTNTLTQQPNKKQGFSTIINSNSMRQMIDKSLGSPEKAASFVSTLISTVNASDQLRQCEADSIVAAALRGEGMKLSLALGQYSIVPYGTKANFQISYKGLSQLGIRSEQYVDFDVYDVREGEYKGKDPRTRAPRIEWLEDEDIRNVTPIVGYYGFYQLKNGFFKSIYWSHDKILSHADRYSKAFSKEKYQALVEGKLEQSDAEKLRRGSPWYDAPTSEAHMKMCRKTLLIQLLNDGKAPLSIEMHTAMEMDKAVESGGVADMSTIIPVNPDTGEVIETTIADEPTETAQSTTEVTEPVKTAKTARAAAESSAEGENTLSGFFGD